MKKVNVLVLTFVLIFALGSMASAANFFEGGSFTAKVGMDINGQGKVKYDEDMEETDEDFDVENAFSISGEYLVPYKDDLEIGVGVTFQTSRTEKDVTTGEFNYTPIYGVAKFQAENGKFSPYFIGQFGYNLFNIEDIEEGIELKGGLYYGFGAGMKVMDNLTAEVLYSVNNGKMEGTEGTAEIDYSKIRAGVSFAF